MGKVSAFPDWQLMAVLVDHLDGQRDLVTHKSIVHLSDEAIKNVCKCLIRLTFMDNYYCRPQTELGHSNEN